MGNKWQMIFIRDKCEARSISDKQTIPFLNDAELVATLESDPDLITDSVSWHKMEWQQKKKSHNIFRLHQLGITNKKNAVLLISIIVVYSCWLLCADLCACQRIQRVHRKYSRRQADKTSKGLQWLCCEERLRKWGSSVWREISGGIWLRFTKLN